MLKQFIFLFLISFVAVLANSADHTTLQSILTPVQKNDGWQVGSVLKKGFDQEAITALAQSLQNREFTNVHAVLIERDGKLVYEQYLSGSDQSWGTPIGDIDYDGSQQHDLRSISKSVTALLLGIALASDFETALKRPVLDYIVHQKSKTSSGIEKVTLRQVLTMSAGFDWNEMTVPYSDSENDEIQLYYTRDPIGYVLSKPLRDKPDERWYYNGGMTMLVGAAILQISGKPFLDFAVEALFKPLGIEDYTWHRPSAWWSSDMMPAVASGLRLLPRDLAKIGSLMINKGKWQGKQIVPEEWVELSSQRYRNDMQPWGGGIYGYGLHWWQGEFQLDGETIAAATGVGYGGQRLFTVADKQLSVTVLAGNYGTSSTAIIWQSEQIFRRVLDAFQP